MSKFHRLPTRIIKEDAIFENSMKGDTKSKDN